MITVKLPDGRRVKINTTDPKAAAAAAKKFLSNAQREPTLAEKAGSVVSALGRGAAEAGTAAIQATPSALRAAGRTARDVAIETLTPSQDVATAIGVPSIGKDQLLKKFRGTETGPVQEAATNLAQDFRERPLETGLSVAAGLTPMGKAAGLAAAGARVAGRVALGTTGALAGSEADKALGKATEGAIGREGEAGDPTVLQAAATQLFGEGIGAALRAASPAFARAQLSTAKTRLAKLEASAGATESQKQQARKVIQSLEDIATQSKEKVLKQAQAEGTLFEKNGQNLRDAMKVIAGDEKKADSLLYADELYDAGEVANLRQPYFGNYARQINKKQRELTEVIDGSLAIKGIGPKDKQAYTDFLRNKLDSAQTELAKKAAAKEQAVFAPPQAPTPILGSELKKLFNSPEITAPMSGGGYSKKLAAIDAAIPTRALTTSDLARVMSTIQEQFVTRDDDVARKIFYGKAFPKLQELFKGVSSGPTGLAAKTYSNAVLDYFDTRFKLANLGDETLNKAVQGSPDAVFNILKSPDALASFSRALKDSLNFKPKEITRYVQTLVRDSLKAGGGEYSPATVARFFGSVDKTVASQVLGKEFFDKLSAVDTVLSGIEAKGVRKRIASLGTAEMMATGNRPEQAIQNILIGETTGQPLQAGAGRAQLGRSIVGALRPLNLDKASFDYVASAAERNLPPEAVFATLGRMAVEAGKPLTFGYETFQEKYNAIQAERDKLKLGGGQGGPEEVAPSMGAERDIASLMRPTDEIGDLIRQSEEPTLGQFIAQAVDQDDFDKLVRTAIPEEMSPVTKKLSTRNEEGFEPRVYRDTKGFRTVGIGFNMDAAGARDAWKGANIAKDFNQVLNGKEILTAQEAEQLFKYTKDVAIRGATKLVRNYSKLGVHQQAALQDMVFQLGEAGAMKFAQTRSLIERGDFAGAARQMMRSANARQTPNRVLRRAYMLQHNVGLAEADAALVKSGKIKASESINKPQELSRLINKVKVAEIPTAKVRVS